MTDTRPQRLPTEDALNIPVDAATAPTEVLTPVLAAATAAIPQLEHAGICVVAKDGTLGSVAVSGPVVGEAFSRESALGGGPCFETMHTGLPVIVQNARTERRWPEFTRQALALGVLAELAVPLVYRARTLGVLTLCWTSPHTLDVTTLELAEAFAVQAAAMIGAQRKAVELEQGMLTRQVIGQAIGFLMCRYDMDPDSAFAYLKRISQNHNVKIRDLARDVVQTRDLPAAHAILSSWPE